MKSLYSFFVLILFFSNVLFGQFDKNKEKVFTSLEAALDENPLRVYYLDLKQQDLKEFPKDILKFEKLIHLNLAHNEISNLENIDLSRMNDLKEIVLYDNKFRFFPYQELDKAKNLSSVDLGENDLKEITSEINTLRFIESIDLNGNRISKISKDIKLPFLTSFKIERNYIDEFPSFLLHSKKLTSLNIYGNHIEAIPNEINALSKLKFLNIGDNPIQTIGPDISLRKLKTIILDWVDLSDPSIHLNFIAKASFLETLSLEHCAIKEIPKEVYHLRRLKEFSVLNNDLIGLNKQILKNKKLSKLWISGNQIKDTDIAMIKNHLKKTEVIND